MRYRDAQLAIRGLRETFGSVRYVLLALCVSGISLAFTLWLPNLGLMYHVLTQADVPLWMRLRVPLAFLGSISTNFSPISAVSAVLISLLFGLDAALLTKYFSRRASGTGGSGLALGTGGMASGILGIGCAACGSVLATGALSLVGATGILVLLPLRGGEFGILGVLLLALSVFSVAKNIAQAPVCIPPIRKNHE